MLWPRPLTWWIKIIRFWKFKFWQNNIIWANTKTFFNICTFWPIKFHECSNSKEYVTFNKVLRETGPSEFKTQTRTPTSQPTAHLKYLQQIRAKSISARAVHGDALSDIIVVTVCVYVLWTWGDPARGVSAGVELGWGGVVRLDGLRVSLKSGFQLNPWLSSKRTRKMTEVHDIVRSPHPAKPFHFGPFVSLQLLIFMITPSWHYPHVRPNTSPHHHPNRREGGGRLDRT